MKAIYFYALLQSFAISFALQDVLVCVADDTSRIRELLASTGSGGGVITIPPGDYRLDGAEPLVLSSNTTILAHGARFHLPKTLPDRAKVVVFTGQDVANFAWHGGEFLGQCFRSNAAR